MTSSETSAYKIQTPENYPQKIIQHTEHGQSLESRRFIMLTSNNSVAAPRPVCPM